MVLGIPHAGGSCSAEQGFRSCAVCRPALISRAELPVAHKWSAPGFSVLSLSLSYPDTIPWKHIVFTNAFPQLFCALCVELLWVPVLLMLFAAPLGCNKGFCSLLLACACTGQGNERTQNHLCWHACGMWLLLKQDFCWLTPRTTATSSITRNSS